MTKMQSIYQSLRECVFRITAKNEKGDYFVGSGFHIGDGYIATARHVVEGFSSLEIEHPDGFAMIDAVLAESIIFPEDDRIDLAIIKAEIRFTEYYLKGYKSIPGQTLADFRGIPFGSLVDEAVSDGHILEEVILIGFPRIPLSDEPQLVAVKGEINATVRSYLAPNYYLHVISSVARGGFSGGPVIDSQGFLLGVFTHSLLADDQSLENGFSAVLSIEALLELLRLNRIKLSDNMNVLVDSSGDYEEWYESKKHK